MFSLAQKYFSIFFIKLSFLITLVMMSACSKDNLPNFNKLEGLRILAFQTTTPEVSPGDTLTLTPVISDINASTLTYSASSCIDLGISYGAEPSCENNPSKVIIATNATMTLPGFSESWTGLADSISVTVPVDAIMFAARSAKEQYNGVSYLLDYTLTNDRGENVHAIKRIVVSLSSKTAKNTNPTITNIFADGVSMATLPLATVINLSTDLAMSSAQTYTVQNTDGSFSDKSEQLATTWFITDGETKFYRSDDIKTNEYTTPTAMPTGRSVYILAIARDDRGGLSVVKKKF